MQSLGFLLWRCCPCLGSLLVGFVSLAVLPAPGQSPPASPDNQPPPAITTATEVPEISSEEQTQSFKVKVNLVEVRVVVRDAKGNAVGNLKQDDFVLLDDKKPQTITRFAVERNDGILRSPPASAPSHLADEMHSHLAPGRFVAYVFDDLHLDPLHLSSARNAAISRLDSLQPSERWAIYATSGLVQLDFTNDRSTLEQALRRINSRIESTTSDCPYISYYQADLIINKNDSQAFQAAVRDYIACNNIPYDSPTQADAAIAAASPVVTALARQVLDRGESQTKLAFNTLNDVVRKLGIMPGERTVILVSPGFLVTEARRTESAVIERALNSKVVVSSLDARGLYARNPAGDISRKKSASSASLVYENQLAADSASSESQVLAEMAYATGGRFVQNTNDLAAGLGTLTRSPEFSYLLAFTPQNLQNNGKFHNLKVELKQPAGYSVQARTGYYAPSPGGSAEQVKREIAESVFAHDEIRELPLQVQTQFFRSSQDAAHISVLVHVDVRHMQFHKDDGRNLNELTVVAALFDRNDNFVAAKSTTVKMHIKDDTLSSKLNSGIMVKSNFDVNPGSYLVRIVARDAQGKMTTQSDVIDIP
jgi:VWFA-related protein